MVGLGMIFDETYRPFFEQLHADGPVPPRLRPGRGRAGRRRQPDRHAGPRRYRQQPAGRIGQFASFSGPDAVDATARSTASMPSASPRPDDRHFDAGPARPGGRQARPDREAVGAVARANWTSSTALAERNGVLAKVVYHKLADPDHKKLRTHVADGVLRHVNNGYCSLLEPKSISGGQFAEWIAGRNPAPTSPSTTSS